MYGYFNRVIKSFVIGKFGDESWNAVVKKCSCATDFNEFSVYDDDVTSKLLDAASDVTGFQKDALMAMMGEHYVVMLQESGHDELMKNLGDNMLDFVENLDYLHTYMMSDYPDIKMPSFRCEPNSQKDKMTLHYYSYRDGLHMLVAGILKSIAKVYYKSDLTIEVDVKDTVEVASKNGLRHHVIFSMYTGKAKVQGPESEPPPTFVAQTRKNAEIQLKKKNIEVYEDRIQQIIREQGVDALPLNKKRAIQAKWKSVAKMSVLYGGFVPQYPQTLSIPVKTFCNTFPYHVVFNSNMFIIHSGIKLQKIQPGIRNPTSRVDAFLTLLHPSCVTFTFENIRKFINTPVVTKTKPTKMALTWGKRPMVILRGQMLYMEEHNMIVYLCSPFVRSLKDLEARRLHLADIPIHDVTRDLLWMELMSRYRKAGTGRAVSPPSSYQMYGNNESGGKGGRSGTQMDRLAPMMLTPVPVTADHAGVSEADVDALRHQLRQTQNELEDERRKTDWLYQAFLPSTTAAQILNGQQPDAAHYEPVTVLFSDVVSFAYIIAKCNPSETVEMLTTLHKKFNRICRVHETYRVEIIGDAYMVVCGVPDHIISHAERIANTALAMNEVTNEVLCPYNYDKDNKDNPVQIRIGIHTGRVTCGVIGDRLPRYAVMGETVNLASRMESHGVPGKIHISNVTYDCLKHKGFRFDRRGDIDVRSTGRITTYFLIRNENATRDQLLGRLPEHQEVHVTGYKPKVNEVTFINEGKQEHPPSTSSSSKGTPPNKVHPVTIGSRPPSRPTSDEYLPMRYNDSPKHALLSTSSTRNKVQSPGKSPMLSDRRS